jgi:hypothetical protein
VDYDVNVVGCDELAWKLEIPELYVFAYLIDGEASEGSTTHKFDPQLLSNYDTGSHNVDVTLYDTEYYEYPETLYSGFSLTRRTSWGSTFNAAEPVRKGSRFNIEGKLTRANWETNSYGRYAGARVTLQFKAKDSSTWRNVKGVSTDSYGWAKTSVEASKDGTWRYTFGGNSSSGAATSTTDYVDVR